MTEPLRETSTATTDGIRVHVRCAYDPERSLPAIHRYVFLYTVEIRNEGPSAAQLVGRHWVITDAKGKVQEVRGLGVVGENPTLLPGQRFEYTSAAIIETSHGQMHGSYQMHSTAGRTFEAHVAPFLLTLPYSLN